MLQIFQTLTGYGGDSNHVEIILSTPAFELFYLLWIRGVHLRCRDEMGFQRQVLAVLRQLVLYGVEALDRIAFIALSDIDKVEQQARPIDPLDNVSPKACRSPSSLWKRVRSTQRSAAGP